MNPPKMPLHIGADGSIRGKYPTRAYGYDGRIHPEAPTPSEWRAFRLRMARQLGTHTKEEWMRLRDAIGMCVECGRADAPLDKDHIVPLARGGCDCIHNLQPLCGPCNSRKGDRL
jgi:5-methylcytosine-specific restriction endonuclease McrA